MVTYNLENEKPEYVIQERRLHWRGWEFPKAGVELFETKRHAVKREVKEETGLEIIKIKNHHEKGKYKYTKIFPDRPGMIGQTFSLYSVEVKKAKIIIDKKEHFSSKWVSYNQAMKLITHKNQRECLKLVNDWLEEKIKKK